MTEAGHEVLARCDEAVNDMENAMLADLDDDARAQLLDGAHRLRAPPRRRAAGRVGRPPDETSGNLILSPPRRGECLVRHPPRPRPSADEHGEALLRVRDLRVDLRRRGAGAARRVAGRCPSGAIVAVLGNNGAGKSTLLRAISGTLRRAARRGHRRRRSSWRAAACSAATPPTSPAAGVVQVPEGRRIFSQPDGRGEPPRRRARRARQGGARARPRLGARAVPDPRRARRASAPGCSPAASSRCSRSAAR